MLRWTAKPDPVFYDIVSNSLELYQDSVREDIFDDAYNVIEIFGQNGLAIEVEKIIKAHYSKKTYKVTDYHYLILYDALTCYCDLYNDNLFEDTLIGGIHPSQLNIEDMAGIYFWDIDFLFDKEIINGLSVEQKDEMSISSDIFSIANNLTPHSDELMIIEADDFDSIAEVFFKEGKPYPYFDEIDE